MQRCTSDPNGVGDSVSNPGCVGHNIGECTGRDVWACVDLINKIKTSISGRDCTEDKQEHNREDYNRLVELAGLTGTRTHGDAFT